MTDGDDKKDGSGPASDSDGRGGLDRPGGRGGRDGRGERAARWGTAGCVAAVAALLAGLPWAARGRLPGRLATHWSGPGAPDGSMPLWAAAVFPAGIWLLTALAVSLSRRRGRAGTHPWRGIVLAPTGTALVSAQASVVRANLDHTDWHEARQPAWAIVLVLALTGAALAVAWRIAVRVPSATPATAPPELDLPEGERLAWFSHAANPWLQLLSAATGLVAAGTLVALAVGLANPAALWPVCTVCGITALAGGVFSSVRAKVSEAGLEVAFGPLGWPARRWSPAAIESARAEQRRPSEVGGWGYRLSGLGTTVMLRAGDCLVVRPRGRRSDFAVSVDDAERGAALLNSLRRRG